MTDSTETKSEAPSVSAERIEKFYEDLGAMQVSLDPDPLELGPKRINNKFAECRRLLSQTERMFMEVSQDLHWYKREHRRAQATFELDVQELLSNDPDVRSPRNITDRMAIAHVKLRKEREEISRLQFAVEDLEAVAFVIRTKRNDLKDISSRLRDQLKICQEEISLGSRWGSGRSGRPRKTESSQQDTGSSTDLDESVVSLLDGVLSQDEEEETSEEELSLDVKPVAEIPKELKGEEVSNVDEVLDAIGTGAASAPRTLPTPSNTDADLDSLLDGMGEHLPKPIEVKLANDPVLDDILSNFG